MDGVSGLLKVKVKRGINLAVRDACTSDPYIVLTTPYQRKKTRVMKANCNPVWNEDLILSVYNHLHDPIKLTVYDKDRFSKDDAMGDADIDIKPYVECIKMGLQNLPIGTKIDRVYPSRNNCISDESCIIWNEFGKITQDMRLRLRNVECGEVDIQLEWTNSKSI